jgi:hypothetical protein
MILSRIPFGIMLYPPAGAFDGFGAIPVVEGGVAEEVLLVADCLLRGIDMMPAAISNTAAMTNADSLRTLWSPVL